MSETAVEPKPKLRWYQYHLFVLVTVVATLATLITCCEAFARPPSDHPIYQPPDILFPRREIKRVFRAPYKPDRNELTWTFRPARRSLVLGDLIWGKLHIKNDGKGVSYQFSPPYHGRYVSTISLWVSRCAIMMGRGISSGVSSHA